MFKYPEYTACHENTLYEMVNNLYIEDPEGEPMAPGKIQSTIAQAEHFPDRLKIYMFEVSDKPAGYAIIQLIWSNEWGGLTANIDEMYVSKQFRGQGLATDFIRNIQTIVPGINRVTLEVTPSNARGMKFYENLGFKQAENRFMEVLL